MPASTTSSSLGTDAFTPSVPLSSEVRSELGHWPQWAVSSLLSLALRFPQSLQNAFVAVFVCGTPNSDLDKYLDAHPEADEYMLEALRLEGEITLGCSREVLAGLVQSLPAE